MLFRWQTQPEPGKPACSKCNELDGKLDGDGWTSLIPPESKLYATNADGTRRRIDTLGLCGRPPLHPNCRCTIVPANT